MRKTVQVGSNKIDIWKEIFTIAIVFLLVFFISITHLNESNGIKVYADEIGYWRNAALLTGRDWSNEASSNVYYGFGYGFLLVPILELWNTQPEMMMHTAILLQGFLLASCTVAAWLILKRLRINVKWYSKAILMLFSTLYTANVFMVKITMSEILLTTCIWWSSYLALCYIQEKKIHQACGLAIIAVYMFSIHQRMVTVVIVHFLLISVITIFGQKDKKSIILLQAIFWVAIFTGLFLLCKSYDNFYTASLYGKASDAGQEVNRVGMGIKSKIFMLESFEGIILLFKSFCGKLFYAIVATYGIIFFEIIIIFQNIIRDWKQNSNFEMHIWYMYILLNFLGAFGAATLAMSGGFDTRSDILMYGRYTEFTYGPLLLAGAISLYQYKKSDKKIFLFGIVLLGMLCLGCVENTYNSAPNSNFWVNCSALSDLVYKVAANEMTNKEVVLLGTIRCICIMFVFSLGMCCVKRYKRQFVQFMMIIITCIWICTADINWGKNVLPWYVPIEEGMRDIVVGVEAEEAVISLDARLGGCLQFLLPNTALEICSDINEIEVNAGKSYVITDINSEYAEYIRNHYIVDRENNRYMRWLYE